MFGKIKGAWNVFKYGKVVADPAAWKSGQVKANQVTALLAAVVLFAKVLGYDLKLDDDTLGAIGAGLFALLNWLFTVVSTDKIGILGTRPAGDETAPRFDTETYERAMRQSGGPVTTADPQAQNDLRGGP